MAGDGRGTRSTPLSGHSAPAARRQRVDSAASGTARSGREERGDTTVPGPTR